MGLRSAVIGCCVIRPSRSALPSVINSRAANRNAYDQSPFNSQSGNERGCDDETNDLAWRCCFMVAIRTCRSGFGAARHYQSGLVRQFYPNANCQNYGRGNPYTSYGWRRAGHRYYAGHRHHRRHWR
jgi:hypothetical protein